MKHLSDYTRFINDKRSNSGSGSLKENVNFQKSKDEILTKFSTKRISLSEYTSILEHAVKLDNHIQAVELIRDLHNNHPYLKDEKICESNNGQLYVDNGVYRKKFKEIFLAKYKNILKENLNSEKNSKLNEESLIGKASSYLKKK